MDEESPDMVSEDKFPPITDDEPPDADEDAARDEDVLLTQSAFCDLGSVGFGVIYIRDRDTAPVVGLATVDYATEAENTIELAPGQRFGIASQTWQLAQVRRPTKPEWAVILRPLDAAGRTA